MTAAETLFRPFRRDALSLPSRIVMAPMTRSRSPGGMPSDKMADYYARRAAARVGLIITEGVAIERPGALDDPNVPHFHGEAVLAAWRTVVERVHAEGARIMPQLWHVGAQESARSHWVDGDARIEAPSGLGAPGKPLGRAMTDADIADTIAAYAKGAADARELGFDGVEVHAAHGYLIDQYLWAPTNVRDDRWGGETLASRARFAIEIARAIRAATGPDFPLSFRLSQHKQQDYGAVLAETPDELATLLQPLADAGVTIFHGSQRRFWEPAFADSDLNLAGWMKKLTGMTAISVGSVGLSGEFASNFSGEVSQPTPIDKLIERMERDEFDLIAVGRALLHDPQWAVKIADARTEELHPFEMASLKSYY